VPDPLAAVGPTFIRLGSDRNDFVGRGLDFSYTNANSTITVASTGARLTVEVAGDESWLGVFELPDTFRLLETGSYENLQRFGMHTAAVGGMDWSGNGRSCRQLDGWLIIDKVTYDGMELTGIDLRFEQRCQGSATFMQGQVHWLASDTTLAPGPAAAAPQGLWSPAPGIVPASGNYLLLQSDPGQWVDAGGTVVLTALNAAFSLHAVRNTLSLTVIGDEQWGIDFQAMNSLARLEAGFYGNLKRYPVHNVTRGGLSAFGYARTCGQSIGWLMIDDVLYESGAISSIDLRFELNCDRETAPLSGSLHWDAAEGKSGTTTLR
jgi:hypothetical protein